MIEFSSARLTMFDSRSLSQPLLCSSISIIQHMKFVFLLPYPSNVENVPLDSKLHLEPSTNFTLVYLSVYGVDWLADQIICQLLEKDLDLSLFFFFLPERFLRRILDRLSWKLPKCRFMFNVQPFYLYFCESCPSILCLKSSDTTSQVWRAFCS